MFKKIVSVVMAVLMTVSVFAFSASAATKSGKRYRVITALGDSASSGYGLPDYQKYGQTVIYEKRIANSYPDLLAKDLGAEKLYPYGVSGIRTTELRYLLDNNYYGDILMDRDMPKMSNDVIKREKLKELKPLYQNAVKQSDLVTLDIGFDDIWIPTIACIYDIADDGIFNQLDPEKTIADKVAKYGSTRVVIENALSYLIAWYTHPAKWVYYWDSWATTVARWLADFYIQYEHIVDQIYYLNPQVTVVAVGCYNPCEEWSIFPGDKAIGHTIQPYYDILNAYKRRFTSRYPTYHYVSARNVDIITKYVQLPLYENLTLDDSGFNPHPTEVGHRDIEQRILRELGEI